MRTTFPEILRAAIADSRRDMHISMPGRIETYDFTAQKASVKPLLNPTLADGRVLDLPVVSNVRVIWPVSGGASMTFPIQRGDGCLLVFSEASLDEWLDRGGVVAVDDPRRNSLQDAMAIMGMDAFSAGTQAENNRDVLLTYDGSRVRLKPGGLTEIECTTAHVVAQDVLSESQTLTGIAATQATVTAPQITLNGNVQINGALLVSNGITFGSDGTGDMVGNGTIETTGDVIANGTSLDHHTHGGVQSGSSSTGEPE